MPNSTEKPISADLATTILSSIKEKRWWQGSVIPSASLLPYITSDNKADFWIITSQTCNLYNDNFQKVPVFELVAGYQITKVASNHSKGDHPRTLHVEAWSDDNESHIALEIDIQKRCWLPRRLLYEIQKPKYHIHQPQQHEVDWLDNFAGWLGRSYTRLALPDEFNDAMNKSRIEEVLNEKLTKYHKELFGIYFELETDNPSWNGRLGEMPPIYQLV